MSLNVAGRLGWAFVGGFVVLVSALSLWPEPVYYPHVIVPAARIIERETPPGPPSLLQKIEYVYLQPDVRAVAPGAVSLDVARFCRPVLVPDTGQTRTESPTPSVIRSVAYNPSLVPLVKDRLLVTSMTGYGDLVAEDYTVRAPFGVAAGLEEPYRTVVRYPRWAAPVGYARDALEIYGAVRLLLDVVR